MTFENIMTLENIRVPTSELWYIYYITPMHESTNF